MTTAIYKGLLNAIIAVMSGVHKLWHVSLFLQAMRELFLLVFNQIEWTCLSDVI